MGDALNEGSVKTREKVHLVVAIDCPIKLVAALAGLLNRLHFQSRREVHQIRLSEVHSRSSRIQIYPPYVDARVWEIYGPP
jgi:hypothetical protein